MAVRIRIAVKIFALAVSLLALTVALSIFGIWQTRHLRLELSRVADRDLPLQNMVQETDYAALLRRLAFERCVALAAESRPRPSLLRSRVR